MRLREQICKSGTFTIASLFFFSSCTLALSSQEDGLIRRASETLGNGQSLTEYSTDEMSRPSVFVYQTPDFQIRLDESKCDENGFTIDVTRRYAADSEELRELFPAFHKQLGAVHQPMIDGTVQLIVQVKSSHHIGSEAELRDMVPEILGISDVFFRRFVRVHSILAKTRYRSLREKGFLRE